MKLHNHTELQDRTLMQGINSLAALLAQTNFDEPEKDELMIRRQVYLKGKMDQLVEMLKDDYPDPAANAAIQQAQQT